MRAILRLALAALPLAFALSAGAAEPDFPSKPLRLLVGYAPASGADVVARILGNKLGETFRNGVIVENKTGAGGVIAAQETARAAPDGHTLMVVAMPQLTICLSSAKSPTMPSATSRPCRRWWPPISCW